MDRVIALRQISVTALFYLDNSRKIHLRGVRACRPTDAKRRAPQSAGAAWGVGGGELWLLFVSPGPVLCKLGQPGVFILPEVLTPVLGPSFVLFLRAFLFLIF